MLVLLIRTDKPEAELHIYDGDKKLAEVKWQAHLQLAETLNSKIDEILNKSSISAKDLKSIVCYKGPGSFTGLRIGMSVANAMAYAYDLPIVATTGKDWIQAGIKKLAVGKTDKFALPKYDRPAITTHPRK